MLVIFWVRFLVYRISPPFRNLSFHSLGASVSRDRGTKVVQITPGLRVGDSMTRLGTEASLGKGKKKRS